MGDNLTQSMEVSVKGHQAEEAGSRLLTATVLGMRSFREKATCASGAGFCRLCNEYCGSPTGPRLARSRTYVDILTETYHWLRYCSQEQHQALP